VLAPHLLELLVERRDLLDDRHHLRVAQVRLVVGAVGAADAGGGFRSGAGDEGMLRHVLEEPVGDLKEHGLLGRKVGVEGAVGDLI
jgi:hypothetical protein